MQGVDKMILVADAVNNPVSEEQVWAEKGTEKGK